MFHSLMTGWARIGTNEIHFRMICKAVADDNAWEAVFRQLDARVSGVGGGANDGAADALARQKLRGGFTGAAILLHWQNHQIEVGRFNRFCHPLENRDVIWR